MILYTRYLIDIIKDTGMIRGCDSIFSTKKERLKIFRGIKEKKGNRDSGMIKVFGMIREIVE